MPVSIASSLLLLSALLLLGARTEPSQPMRAELVVSSQPTPAKVLSWPIDRSADWTMSEADLEEEDSSDSDDEFVIYELRWNSLLTELTGLSSVQRLGLIAFCPSLRSPILRC